MFYRFDELNFQRGMTWPITFHFNWVLHHGSWTIRLIGSVSSSEEMAIEAFVHKKVQKYDLNISEFYFTFEETMLQYSVTTVLILIFTWQLKGTFLIRCLTAEVFHVPSSHFCRIETWIWILRHSTKFFQLAILLFLHLQPTSSLNSNYLRVSRTNFTFERFFGSVSIEPFEKMPVSGSWIFPFSKFRITFPRFVCMQIWSRKHHNLNFWIVTFFRVIVVTNLLFFAPFHEYEREIIQ